MHLVGKPCCGTNNVRRYSDDAIRYFLEDDPSTPEAEKPCWEAVLDSGGFVKHLKREFGVHPRSVVLVLRVMPLHLYQCASCTVAHPTPSYVLLIMLLSFLLLCLSNNSRTECIAQARNRHVLQASFKIHPRDSFELCTLLASRCP